MPTRASPLPHSSIAAVSHATPSRVASPPSSTASSMVSSQTGARARIATCPTDQFQLSPASAEARFAFLQWRRQWNPEADDPLFRPVDADDFRVNGDAASDFSNLRQNGLVRITYPAAAEHSADRPG